MTTLVTPAVPSDSRTHPLPDPGPDQVGRAPSESPRARRRSAWAALGGCVAGLLAGVDALLVLVLLGMLRGSAADDLVVAGIGHAGWSAAGGVTVGIAPGGAAILLAGVVIGGLVARTVRSRLGRDRLLSSTA